MTVENGFGNVLLRDVYYAMWYGYPIGIFRGATPRMAYSIIAVSFKSAFVVRLLFGYTNRYPDFSIIQWRT